MFSLAYNLPKTMANFCPSKLRQKKYVEITWIFRPAKLRRKKYVETTWIFRSSKLHRKEYVETSGFLDHRNYIEKSTWK